MNYPFESGFVRHSDTSAASAQMLDDSGQAATYDNWILDRLDILGLSGATADELRKILNPRFPHLHNGTVNGRLSTLWKRGEIIKTTDTRLTDARRPAHVYVHGNYASQVRAAPAFAATQHPMAAMTDPEIIRAMEMILQNMDARADGSTVIKLTPMEASIFQRVAEAAGTKKGMNS